MTEDSAADKHSLRVCQNLRLQHVYRSTRQLAVDKHLHVGNYL